MTDETKPAETAEPAPEKVEPAAPSIGLSATAASILAAILGLLGAAAGAGWPGVVALAIVGVALGAGAPAALQVLIRIANGSIDRRDQERAGADSGNTAADLKNQGDTVRQELEAAQAANPPTDGFPKP